MIDDIEKTMVLTEKMQVALPMGAIATNELRRTLQNETNQVFPRECIITEIRYMGDEGGIACHLTFEGSETENVFVASITHLTFDRKNPFAREIELYCNHRTKRLKKLNHTRP